MTKMSKRNNNIRGKTKRGRRGFTAALVWSSVLVLLVFGAFELANQFNLLPEQTNEAMKAAPDSDDRGTLVFNTEDGRCERMEYDNAGHIIDPLRPCSNAERNLDARGRPLPTGTMRRLDAIGNSFLGRQ